MSMKFGQSIAIDNGILAVGAPNNFLNQNEDVRVDDTGAVFLYGDNSGSWDKLQKVVAWGHDSSSGDQFGYAVDGSGATVVVGSPFHAWDVQGNNYRTNAGAVYSWDWTGASWSLKQKIVPSDRQEDDQFGVNVAIDGNTMVVASMTSTDSQGANSVDSAGAIYVFNRANGIWSQTAKLTPQSMDRLPMEAFGSWNVSVNETDSIILVSNPTHSLDSLGNSIDGAGAVWTFEKVGGTWVETQKITLAFRAIGDSFGQSTSYYNGLLVVGTPGNDTDKNNVEQKIDVGAVYVFKKVSGSFTQLQKIVGGTSYRNIGDKAGYSVSGDNGILAVGVPYNDYDQDEEFLIGDGGAVYIWTWNAGNNQWAIQQKIVAQDSSTTIKNSMNRKANDHFGSQVIVSGNLLFVGSPDHDYDANLANPVDNAGAVYVYALTGGVWTLETKLVAFGTNSRQSGDRFGAVMGFNGTRLIVGSSSHSLDVDGLNPLSNAGAAWIFTRAVDGSWTAGQKITAPVRSSGDLFGTSVAINDSGNICVIGAPGATYHTSGACGVGYVFRRTNGIWAVEDKITATGLERFSTDTFGKSISLSGDTLIVGAPTHDFDKNERSPVVGAGAVYVFRFIGNVWSFSQKIVCSERDVNHNFGFTVALDGNTLLVGSPGNQTDISGSNTLVDAGAVFYFSRATGNDPFSQMFKIVPSGTNARNAGDKFGTTLDLSQSSAIIGSPHHTWDQFGQNSILDAGAAWVFVINGGVWVQQAKITGTSLNSRQAGDLFASAVSIDGNVAVVGSPNHPYDEAGLTAKTGAGAAYVFDRIGVPSVSFIGGGVGVSGSVSSSRTVVAKKFSLSGTQTFTLPATAKNVEVKIWANGGASYTGGFTSYRMADSEITGVNASDTATITTGTDCKVQFAKSGITLIAKSGSQTIGSGPTGALVLGGQTYFPAGVADPDWDGSSGCLSTTGLVVIRYTEEISASDQRNTGGTPATAHVSLDVVNDVLIDLILDTNGAGYTSVPSVAFTGGSATATALLTPTSMASINVISGGVGFTKTPVVSITGGGATVNATATAILTPSVIGTATILAGGSGYSAAPTITLSGGGGSGAILRAQLMGSAIGSANVLTSGVGYTGTPTISLAGGEPDTNAILKPVLTPTSVASVVLDHPGQGFTDVPSVSFGTGLATAIAHLSPTTVAFIDVLTNGSGYSIAPTITIQGQSTTVATAVANLRPTSLDAISITTGGEGYTSTPEITFDNGDAIAVARMNQNVQSVVMSFAGFGYTSIPTVSFLADEGTGAVGTAAMKVTSVDVAIGGTNFEVGDLVVINGGAGATPAKFVVNSVGAMGNITSVAIVDPGHYDILPGTRVTSYEIVSGDDYGFVTDTADSTDDYGFVSDVATTVVDYGRTTNGSGAEFNIFFGVASVSISANGNGYIAAPMIDLQGNATATAIMAYDGDIKRIDITHPGVAITAIPQVSITGGNPTIPATAVATIVPTSVMSVSLTNPGAGYVTIPQLSITGGDGDGFTASLTISPTDVAMIEVVSGGEYTETPSVSINGNGSGASATVLLTPTTLDHIEIVSGGGGYKDDPVVTISGGGASTQATADVSIGGGSVVNIVIDNPGSGYTGTVTANVSGGGGSGCQLDIDLSPTSIDHFVVDNAGVGYTSTPTILITGNGHGSSVKEVFSPTSIASVTLHNGGSGYNYWKQVKKVTAMQRDRETGDHFGKFITTDGKYISIGGPDHSYDLNGSDRRDGAGAVWVYGSPSMASSVMLFHDDAAIDINAVLTTVSGHDFSIRVDFNPYTLVANRRLFNLNNSIVALLENGKVNLYVGSFVIEAADLSGKDGTSNRWYSITLTYNATSHRLTTYFDYKLKTSVTVDIALVASNQALYNKAILYNGEMDNILVWNKELTVSEVSSNKTTIFTGAEANLIGFYNASSINGFILTDHTPHGNHGSIIGSLTSIASSAWNFLQKIIPSGLNARNSGDGFGSTIASSNAVITVGSPHHAFDADGQNAVMNSGAAFVYELQNGSFIQTAKLIASGVNGRHADDMFASSLSQDGNTIAIGSPHHGFDSDGINEAADAGAVFIYRKNGQTWMLEQKIVPTSVNGRNSGDQFGYSVAVSGDFLVVGSPYHSYDIGGSAYSNQAGAVFIFQRQNGVWEQILKRTAFGTNERRESDWFGSSVSFNGSTLVVGCPGNDYDAHGSNLLDHAGAAFTFTVNGTDFTPDSKFVATSRSSGMLYGGKVDVSGQTIAIGAATSQLVQVFKNINGVWTEQLVTAPPVTYGSENSILMNFDGSILNEANTSQTITVDHCTVDTTNFYTGSGSLSFTRSSGAQGYVQAPSIGSLGTSDFAYEVRFRPTKAGATPGASQTIFVGGITVAANLVVENADINAKNIGTISLFVSNNGTSWDIANNYNLGTVQADTWCHLIVQRIGGNVYAYLNGALVATIVVGTLVIGTNNTLPVSIGGFYNAFYGNIDSFRLMVGTSFDATGIVSAYNAGSAITYRANAQYGRGSSFKLLGENGLLDGLYKWGEDFIRKSTYPFLEEAGTVTLLTNGTSGYKVANCFSADAVGRATPLTLVRSIGEGFGSSVCVRNGSVFVGSPNNPTNSTGVSYLAGAGAVYKYLYDPASSLSFACKISPPERNQTNMNFGSAIDFAGDRLYVSSPAFSKFYVSWIGGNTKYYRLERKIDRFIFQDDYTPMLDGGIVAYVTTNQTAGNVYPTGASSSQAMIAISADAYGVVFNNVSEINAGLYNAVAAGTVSVVSTSGVMASCYNAGTDKNRQSGDGFGSQVATNGSVVLVSAPTHGWDVYGNTNVTSSGSIYSYIYDGVQHIWTLEKHIRQITPVANNRLGQFMSLRGETLVSSFPQNSGVNNGLVVFTRNSGAWPSTIVAASSLQTSSASGSSICVLDDSNILLGCPSYTVGTNVNLGAAQILTKTASWAVNGLLVNDNTYTATMNAGDGNGYGVFLNATGLFVLAKNHNLDGTATTVSPGVVFTYTKNTNDVFKYSTRISVSDGSFVPDTMIGDANAVVVGSSSFMRAYDISTITTLIQRASASQAARLVSLVNPTLMVIGKPTTSQASGANYGSFITATRANTGVVWGSFSSDQFVPGHTAKRLENGLVNNSQYFVMGRNTGDRFGEAVELKNSTLFVTSAFHRWSANGVDTNKRQGGVFVYTQDVDSSFQYNTKIINQTASAVDYQAMGSKLKSYNGYLTMSGTVNTTGASSYLSWIMKRSGTGLTSSWALEQELSTSCDIRALTMVSDTLIVHGVSTASDPITSIAAGTITSRFRSNPSWAQALTTATISEPGSANARQAGDGFGSAVTTTGTKVYIGSPNHSYNGNGSLGYSNQGAFFQYTNDGSAWVYQTKQISASSSANAKFGKNIKVQGNYVSVTGDSRMEVLNENTGVFTFQTGFNSTAYSRGAIGIDNDSRIIVGEYNNATNGGSGVFYNLTRSSSTWTSSAAYFTSSFDGLGIEIQPAPMITRSASAGYGSQVAIVDNLIYTSEPGQNRFWVYGLYDGIYRFVTTVNTGNNVGTVMTMKGDLIMLANPAYSNNAGYMMGYRKSGAKTFTQEFAFQGVATEKTGSCLAITGTSSSPTVISYGAPSATGYPYLADSGSFYTQIKGSSWSPLYPNTNVKFYWGPDTINPIASGYTLAPLGAIVAGGGNGGNTGGAGNAGQVVIEGVGTYVGANSTGTYTVAAGITSITVRVRGGGGGGGYNHNGFIGGGGGGGADIYVKIPVTPGMVFDWKVGAGGLAQNDGSPSWLNINGLTVFYAPGGKFGKDSSNTYNGAAGAEGFAVGITNSYYSGGFVTPNFYANRSQDDNMGSSVAITGSSPYAFAVGTPGFDFNSLGQDATGAGMVAVFRWDGSRYIQNEGLFSSVSNDQAFGTKVSSKNNYLSATSAAGSTVLFSNSPATVNFSQQVGAVVGNVATFVNDSLVVFGDTSGASSPGYGALTNSGHIQTYIRAGSTWSDNGFSLVPGYSHGRFANDDFGRSVLVDSNYLYISAPKHDYTVNGGTYVVDQGAIFGFALDGLTNTFKYAGKFTSGGNLLGNTGLKKISPTILATIDSTTSKATLFSVGVDNSLVVTRTLSGNGPIAMKSLDGVEFFQGNITDGVGTNGQPIVTNAGSVSWTTTSGNGIATVPGSSNGRNANDLFGSSVAITSDYIAVGSTGHSFSEIGNTRSSNTGAVFIYSKGLGDSKYLFERKLVSGSNTLNNFGKSLIVRGNYLFSGHSASQYGEILYRGGAGNWVSQTTIGNAKVGTLGTSVCFPADNQIVLGNPTGDGTNVSQAVALQNCGEFRTLVRNVSTWTDKGWTILDGPVNSRQAGDLFGTVMDVNQNFLVVGAPAHDFDASGSNQVSNAGAIFIFGRTGNTYSFLGKFVAGDRSSNAQFGSSVAIDSRGVYITVGAPGANRAYIYSWDGKNLVEMKKLSGTTGELYGTSVAINGDYAAVGVPSRLVSGTAAGAVEVHKLVNGVWTLMETRSGFSVDLSGGKTTTNAVKSGDMFGSSVAISNKKALAIGAPSHDWDAQGANQITDSGTIYLSSLTL